MKILAIETSTLFGGLALMDSETGLMAEVRMSVKASHSERVMLNVDHVLKETGLSVGDLDAIAVSTGPGSFTGLRIAMSTAKGLSFASGVNVVGIPTLEAFAWALPLSCYPVCPMLDARRKEVYAGVFRINAGTRLERIMSETPIKPSYLADKLKELGPVVLMGQGAVFYKKVFEDSLGENAHFAPQHLMAPSPAALAYAGLKRVLAGDFDDPATIAPLYIRKSEAELNWKTSA
jgi:tRNA threonylcarbamoyladenosine biosynthesis protein TsaB